MRYDYKEYFVGKKITMLGLGLLGRGVNVAKFLAEHGAILTITDLKTTEQLAPSLRALKKSPHVRFHLGGHRMSDFRNADMVIKAAGVPLDSPYVKEARKHNIPIEMDASLFAKLAPKGVTIVGVTGTRGKSTVSHLIHYILESTRAALVLVQGLPLYGRVYLAGNIRGTATLPLLKKVRAGDIVVLELDSWQLQGFGDVKISPHIAVFTTFFPDHLNYYKGNLERYFADKAYIFTNQKKEDMLIVGDTVSSAVKKYKYHPRAKMARGTAWRGDTILAGEHNRENIGLAVAVCRALGVSEKDIKKGAESFRSVPGRLQFVRETRGVKYYNDTTATSPEGLFVALDALAEKRKKNIILLAGGADKGFNYHSMAMRMHRTAKALILFKGEGTNKIIAALPKKKPYPFFVAESMKEAIVAARACTRRGDTILLSPGTSSFGVFKNEYDRGDQFISLVKKLK